MVEAPNRARAPHSIIVATRRGLLTGGAKVIDVKSNTAKATRHAAIAAATIGVVTSVGWLNRVWA
ncbi:MAG TPA: hypothetical protein VII73_10675 [Caulobacteraceae bacterium]